MWLNREPTAPAASAIKYQIKTFDRELNTSSIYTAAPSPEVDAAWDQLYKSAFSQNTLASFYSTNSPYPNLTNYVYNQQSLFLYITAFMSLKQLADSPTDAEIRVSAEDLRKINRTSVAFADGSGYLATLDVMHQLHCVVRPFPLLTLFPFHIKMSVGQSVGNRVEPYPEVHLHGTLSAEFWLR